MGLNVSMDYMLQFENKENLKSAAKNILTNSGANTEATQKIIQQTIFEGDRQMKEAYLNSQMAILKASTQISVNGTLKETLRYLKSQPKKDVKKEPVFGEIWNIFSANNEASEKNPYEEIYGFEIDKNAKNIFAAA